MRCPECDSCDIRREPRAPETGPWDYKCQSCGHEAYRGEFCDPPARIVTPEDLGDDDIEGNQRDTGVDMEAGVVVGKAGEPIYWHAPKGRTAAYLPDSPTLWQVLWHNRTVLQGFAHSHPGSGYPHPSHEDVTTFAAVESGLGKRLDWWIATEDELSLVRWAGPGRLDYTTWFSPTSEPEWVGELRKLSREEANDGNGRN